MVEWEVEAFKAISEASTPMNANTLERADALIRSHAARRRHCRPIAERYDDMNAFWGAVAKQERGQDVGAFWDTYENGARRRFEQHLARVYGSEEALLLNAGMTALDLVIRTFSCPGGLISAPESTYFETTELLDLFLQAGVVVARRPEMAAPRLASAVPTLALVESVRNAPGLYRARAVELERQSYDVVLVDNTVASHSLMYEEIRAEFGTNAVVVESGVKYLTRNCSFGVIYGPNSLLGPIRRVARQTGSQLQDAALQTLTTTEINLARRRIELHTRGAMTFRDTLNRKLWHGELLEREHIEHGGKGGALVFAQLKGGEGALHAAVMDNWRSQVSAAGGRVDIRAGFGWHHTAGRSYGRDALNSEEYGSFIRIAVGLEEDETLVRMAEMLNAAALETRVS